MDGVVGRCTTSIFIPEREKQFSNVRTRTNLHGWSEFRPLTLSSLFDRLSLFRYKSICRISILKRRASLGTLCSNRTPVAQRFSKWNTTPSKSQNKTQRYNGEDLCRLFSCVRLSDDHSEETKKTEITFPFLVLNSACLFFECFSTVSE